MFLNIYQIGRPQSLIIVFTGVLFLDQLCKNAFFMQENYQANHHALFGLYVNYFYALVALGLFLYITWRETNNERKKYLLPLTLILSGIASNLIDKIRFDFIIDYINFFNICIFNLADIAILLGAIIFIWQIIKE